MLPVQLQNDLAVAGKHEATTLEIKIFVKRKWQYAQLLRIFVPEFLNFFMRNICAVVARMVEKTPIFCSQVQFDLVITRCLFERWKTRYPSSFL